MSLMTIIGKFIVTTLGSDDTSIPTSKAVKDVTDAKVPLSTVTTAGDLIVGTGSGTVSRLGKGTALQVLRVNSDGTALEYADPSGGGLGEAEVIARAIIFNGDM